MKNFDQWTEELSKQIFVRDEEQDMKISWEMAQTFDDDFEEEG